MIEVHANHLEQLETNDQFNQLLDRGEVQVKTQGAKTRIMANRPTEINVIDLLIEEGVDYTFSWEG